MFTLLERRPKWVAEACPAWRSTLGKLLLQKFLILTQSLAITKASAKLIIAQINEMGELASMLRSCDVTNEVAADHAPHPGSAAETHTAGSQGSG